MRRQKLILVAAVLGVAALVTQAALSGVSAATRARVTAPAQPSTGSSAITTLGSGGWKVLTSATAVQSGQQISTPGFSTAGWLSVTNDDAGAPGTEINALLQNGNCPR